MNTDGKYNAMIVRSHSWGNASDTGTRSAKAQEQYWGEQTDATIGKPNEEHFGDLMVRLYTNYRKEKGRLLPHMKETVRSLSWTNVASRLIEIVEDKIRQEEHRHPALLSVPA